MFKMCSDKSNYSVVEMFAKASLLFVILLFFACSKNEQTGLSVLNTDDQILVGTDTFDVSSFMLEVQNIPSDPDSLLLGEADSRLGTIHADILTQFTCPEGFIFPDNAILDSAVLQLYYQNWYGDGNTPMSITAYMLDKQTLDYDSTYYTDIDPYDYCSLTDSVVAVVQPRIITAAAPADSISTSSIEASIIRFQLNDNVINRLYNGGKYLSQEQFNQYFKGLYITSDFGSSTVLYIGSMSVSLYYHFQYSVEGRDTTANDIVSFYATDEVRVVNRIKNIHADDFVDVLLQDSALSYVSSPANVYTVLSLPISEMVKNVKDSILMGKRPYVNSARVKLYATNYVSTVDVTDVSQWAQPPTNMLLIEEDGVDEFFYSRSLPNDSSAMLSSLYTEVDSLDNVHAYYSYDLSTVLTRALRSPAPVDTLYMLLVPVAVETVTSSTYGTTAITSVRPLQTITTTIINTQFNREFPLRVSVVATGL